MSLHTTFNLCEAVFWVAISIILAWRARAAQSDLRQVGFVAALAFFVFAGTDIIEAKTGAWYRPLGLLIYNTACLIVILGCYLRYRVLRKATKDTNALEADTAERPETTK